MRRENYITDGDLYKESKRKIKSMKSKYRKVLVVIDFRKQLIRFKDDRIDEDYQEEKDIKFCDVIEVERQNLDIYKAEHKQPTLLFKTKFSL